jgi:threonine dehydrogenase-like Zn-dependent dehydrogenase
MGQKSRCAIQTGPRRLEVLELDVPAAVGPGEAVLEVEACGMCGSDFDQYVGYYEKTGMVDYPNIPGHEIVGRLVDISSEFAAGAGLRRGDRVAVESAVSCRYCEFCRNDNAMLCPQKRFLYGFRATTIGSGLSGGYSEYLVLQPGTTMHRVSPDVRPEDAVLFNPLGAGFEWALRLGGIRVGDRVLVLGPGLRGLGAVIAAREAGASQIIVSGLARDA